VAAVFAVGAVLSVLRFTRGLGAVTALTDDVPWGLWIAVKLCFIAVAAGAFSLATAVYLMHLERFRPLVRPAVLTGLIFYTLFVLALMLDLGMPLRFYHPVFMWQHHSVLFEVSWCVMLYTCVLAAELSPAVWDRLGLKRMRRWVEAAVVPLVIAGVVLSVLHQSSLGGLFVILPHRLHPLWHTPVLPLLFLMSAMGSGAAVVILVTKAVSRIRSRPVPAGLLDSLAVFAAWVFVLYGGIRVGDLLVRGEAAGLAAGRYGWLFLSEIVLGMAVPAVVFGLKSMRANPFMLLAGSASAVVGTCLNRFNVGLLGMIRPASTSYVPTWIEVGVVVGLVALGALMFIGAARYLPIFGQTQTTGQSGSGQSGSGQSGSGVSALRGRTSR
jgi:Ni/Fe-hydrogenase subunit HybB-like protein